VPPVGHWPLHAQGPGGARSAGGPARPGRDGGTGAAGAHVGRMLGRRALPAAAGQAGRPPSAQPARGRWSCRG